MSAADGNNGSVSVSRTVAASVYEDASASVSLRPYLQFPPLLCRAIPSDAGMANCTAVSSSHA
eukprot:4211870-Prorocentrum_lima.AAC.1